MLAGDEHAEGRRRFVDDVLLHEQVHQYQQEVSGELDAGYHGHGPAFRDQANRIGGALGLAPVRTSKRRGVDADLPSCAQWPHNVRGSEHYLGAYGAPASAPAGIREASPLERTREELVAIARTLDAAPCDAFRIALDVDSPRLAELMHAFHDVIDAGHRALERLGLPDLRGLDDELDEEAET